MLKGGEHLDRFRCTVEIIEPQLGTVPKDPNVYAAFIKKRAEELGIDNTHGELDEELETIETVEEKGWTGFHKDDKGPFVLNYMVKGQIKCALETLIEVGAIPKIKAYRKWADRMIHVYPRRIYFHRNGVNLAGTGKVLERPLRVMTPKGERVTVARSDTVEPGSRLTYEICILRNGKHLTVNAVREALDYGWFLGLGQWRSAGWGNFRVVEWKEVQIPKDWYADPYTYEQAHGSMVSAPNPN